MRITIPLLIILPLAVAIAVWPLQPQTDNSTSSDTPTEIPLTAQHTPNVEPKYQLLINKHQYNTQKPEQTDTRLQQALIKVDEWLEGGQAGLAANYINSHYSAFSSSELDQLKALFLKRWQNNELAVANYQTATRVFDDLESWDALTGASLQARDWAGSYRALMRASELENDPEHLEEKLALLVKVTSYLRANMEKHGDELGIRTLYQDVYERHPNYPRFQLELGNAHLRLGEVNEAARLLSGLVYDPDYGSIAQQTLQRIEQDSQQHSQQESEGHPQGHPLATAQASDIVVPLVRSGTSFLIDTAIDNRHSRLLLDTGASITALSTDMIQRLNLAPTGQVIQINTANGSRSARLFRTGKLRLGRFQLSGLVVAEIDLGHASEFDGLLGTDALNHLGSDYSYLIDNENNSLIFRRR